MQNLDWNISDESHVRILLAQLTQIHTRRFVGLEPAVDAHLVEHHIAQRPEVSVAAEEVMQTLFVSRIDKSLKRRKHYLAKQVGRNRRPGFGADIHAGEINGLP